MTSSLELHEEQAIYTDTAETAAFVDFTDPAQYEEFYDIAIRIAHKYHFGSPQEIDDIAQEAMLRCWRSGQEQVQTPVSYIFRVVKNIIIDRWRNHDSRQAIPFEDPQAAASIDRTPQPFSPEDLLDSKDTLRRIGERAMLSSTQMDVLGPFLSGRSPAEIAQNIGLSTNDVQARLSRARKKLRKATEEITSEDSRLLA